MLTPETVHYNLVDNILSKRQNVLDDVYRKFPQRFVKGPPKTKRPDNEVWINKPEFNEKNAVKVSLNKFNKVSHYC